MTILIVYQLNRRKNIFSPSPFSPENLVSRDRFGRPVPRQLAINSGHELYSKNRKIAHPGDSNHGE